MHRSSIVEKPANKNFKMDIEYSMKYSRRLLKIIGVWPMISKDCSKISQYFFPIWIIIGFGFLLFVLIPVLFHLTLSDISPMKKIRLGGPVVVAMFACQLKYALLIMCSGMIKLSMKHMETDWMDVKSPSERAIMIEQVEVGRKLTFIVAVTMYSSAVIHVVIKQIVRAFIIHGINQTVPVRPPVLYPGYDIFVDPYKTPTYEIIHCCIFLTFMVGYNINITGCNLAAAFISHACGQIRIVILRLKSIVDGIEDSSDNDELQKRISFALRCHVRGLRLSTQINETLSTVCLVEATSDTLIGCLLENTILTEWKNGNVAGLIPYVIILLSYIFHIFIYCYIGELLKEQYHEVATAAYMIDWYNLPGKSPLALVMVMAMANIPRKFTAGHIIDFSVATFAAILKTSFAYLNMLRSFAEQ